ncbi:MAG TPA: rhomboid family intramembrane serine protease [Longimicrobium sp.]|nr:rhomboid family intramembrane serine protease [Longimicrobium sp.]
MSILRIGKVETTEPTDARRPWEVETRIPKPDTGEYGYLSGNTLVPLSREALMRFVGHSDSPPLVWTPEADILVPPWEVPYLWEAMRAKMEEPELGRFHFAAGASILLTIFCAVLDLRFGAFAAVLLTPWVLYVRHNARKPKTAPTLEQMRAAAQATRHSTWTHSRPAPYTRAFEIMLIAVGAVQFFFMESSVEAGALDAGPIAAGEWWRVGTCIVLHGGTWHFLMNFSALKGLGRLVEAHAPRAWLPVVFLLTALAGSAASLLLPPYGRSVGASGGLMGMIGFLAVLGFRRRAHLPEGFGKLMLQNIGYTALLGVVGFLFIDNAAHAGGLVAGALIGALVIPRETPLEAWTEGPALRVAGLACAGVVALLATAAVGLTFFR